MKLLGFNCHVVTTKRETRGGWGEVEVGDGVGGGEGRGVVGVGMQTGKELDE